MYKIVAMDLDETLLDLNKNCCQRNLDAIAKAQKLGVRVMNEEEFLTYIKKGEN